MKRFSKFIQESIELEEKLKASDDMGDWVKDFQDSDAPQFKGKSQKKRQQMAIAAKLDAEREAGMRKEEAELDEERKSSSYQFTHKPGDAESEKKLADLKKSVKGTGKRVVLQGRLGKDNPNAHKYSKDAPSAKYVDGKRVNSDVSGKSGGHSHQRIQKADAAHHDVYVYNRNEEVEQIDEISQEKLRDYHAAAGADRQKAKGQVEKIFKDKKPTPEKVQKTADAYKRFIKRGKGMTAAANKMSETVDLDEVSDKKLDAYRQKAFADQPSGDDGSDKYRKRKFGRDLAFAKQTGRAKVLATKEEVEINEASDLRVTKVYNKFPKKATYAVHTLDRKYYKEFDTEAEAKKHLETKK